MSELTNTIQRPTDAANEIERLKAENAHLYAEWQLDKETADRLIEHSTKRADRLAVENLELRAALRSILLLVEEHGGKVLLAHATEIFEIRQSLKEKP